MSPAAMEVVDSKDPMVEVDSTDPMVEVDCTFSRKNETKMYSTTFIYLPTNLPDILSTSNNHGAMYTTIWFVGFICVAEYAMVTWKDQHTSLSSVSSFKTQPKTWLFREAFS